MARRVLVVSPHPDDESVGCGGTVRAHVVDGDAVEVLFLTSGERGGHGRSEPETARVREEEARAAGAILGVRDLVFLRARDGSIRATPALVDRVAREFADRAPDLVYVTHPEEEHRDHAEAARVVEAALAASGRTPEVRSYEVWTPLRSLEHLVDITPFLEAKVAAIRAYRSQCAVLRFDEAATGLARWRGEMFLWPKEVGGGRFAEVFGTLARPPGSPAC